LSVRDPRQEPADTPPQQTTSPQRSTPPFQPSSTSRSAVSPFAQRTVGAVFSRLGLSSSSADQSRPEEGVLASDDIPHEACFGRGQRGRVQVCDHVVRRESADLRDPVSCRALPRVLPLRPFLGILDPFGSSSSTIPDPRSLDPAHPSLALTYVTPKRSHSRLRLRLRPQPRPRLPLRT
jgi:hypothetical protein